MSKKHEWLPESEAAKMLGYQPETLRKYVKKGKIAVNYYTLSGRKFHYSKNDIETLMLKHSTVLG